MNQHWRCRWTQGQREGIERVERVLNLEFKEICSVESHLRSVFFMLFNPMRDESSLLKVREREGESIDSCIQRDMLC